MFLFMGDVMIECVNNLYWAQDLPGEEFVQPLKNYHGFMVSRASSDNSNSTLWRIAHIATAIFAYPIFGALALIGMGLNLLGLGGLKRHNEEQKRSVAFLKKLITTVPFSSMDLTASKGYAIRVAVAYKIAPQKLEGITKDVVNRKLDALITTLNQEIDAFTQRYQKVTVQYDGHWPVKGARILLTLFESTSPYCRRDDGLTREVAIG